MSQVTKQEPSRSRALPTGWPVRKTPRWVLLALVLFLAVAVAVALVHKPSKAERASDMRGFLQEVNGDIESCAGGVGESLTALRLVQSGKDSSSTDVSDGISVAEQGAGNCLPANNEEIDDLETYQVPESLDGFGLPGAVTDLLTWATPDAERVQEDVANLLGATTPHARAQAQAALSKDLVVLNAERTRAEAPIAKAIKALSLHATPPNLPG